MKYKIQLLFDIVLLSIFIDLSIACAGNKIEWGYVKNCNEENVIKVSTNSSFKLTKECDLIIVGCVDTVGYQKASANIRTYKNNVLMGQVQGFNLCEAFENRNAQALENIERLIPDKCPIEKVSKCLDGSIKINLSKFKLILIAFRGNKIKYDINIEHENGQTCIKYEFTLVNE